MAHLNEIDLVRGAADSGGPPGDDNHSIVNAHHRVSYPASPICRANLLRMARIEDYALIGDTNSAGLVSRNGSIDWLCFPRFDSDACLGALLDEKRGGHWRLSPARGGYKIRRSYHGNSLVLTTTFDGDGDSVMVVDCMPLSADASGKPRGISPDRALLRVVRGLRGSTDMVMELSPRFDYGRSVPWIYEEGDVLEAAVGPDALDVSATVGLDVEGGDIRASFEVSEGDAAAF